MVRIRLPPAESQQRTQQLRFRRIFELLLHNTIRHSRRHVSSSIHSKITRSAPRGTRRSHVVLLSQSLAEQIRTWRRRFLLPVGLRWRWHLICRRAQIPPTSTSERSVALFSGRSRRGDWGCGGRRDRRSHRRGIRWHRPARQPLRRHRDTEWVARAAPPSRNWPTRAARCSIFNIRFRCRGCIAWANDNRSGTRSVAARASTPIS
jgi:hypothetical protein